MGNESQVEVMHAGMAEGTRGERRQAKQNSRKTSIDFYPCQLHGDFAIAFQRTYYNGVPLGDFIVQ